MIFKTRFAPSPTGYLHLGGARTAIYNYLIAKKSGGKFYLRIEDTDPERSKDEFRIDIIESLKWLSLDWDGEVVYQSKRKEIYNKYLQLLENNGFVYRCYCNKEELQIEREAQESQKIAPKYSRKCRELKENPDKPYVVRFKTPLDGKIAINDLVQGAVEYDLSFFDDFIIRRQDGSYTYNFTVVCDDIEMEISHVLRGKDHLNNTPKQILIYNALNARLPEFGHLPLILGQDGSRLSKRHGATSVNNYRKEGYLSTAMVNFLAKIGWSHGNQEFFTLNQLIEQFDIEGISKSSGIFNIEKLNWLNKQHLIAKSREEIANMLLCENLIVKDSIDSNLLKLIELSKIRSRNIFELRDGLNFYLEEKLDYPNELMEKIKDENTITTIQNICDFLNKIATFEAKVLEEEFRALAVTLNIKLKRIAEILRIILTGKEVSPPIFDVMEILGRVRTIERLKHVNLILERNILLQ